MLKQNVPVVWSQGLASEVAARERQLLRSAWRALVQPLQLGRWAHQRALLRRAFLALRAAPTVKAARISAFWVAWRVRAPLQRCCSSVQASILDYEVHGRRPRPCCWWGSWVTVTRDGLDAAVQRCCLL